MRLNIDRTQAKTLGVAVSDIFDTLQVYFGSYYVNDFNKFGRTWQVNVQAGEDFRERIDDIKQLKVRNAAGGMVPLSTVLSVGDASGPVLIQRYNLYESAAINASAKPGTSSGQAIAALQETAQKQLEEASPTMQTDWTELALLAVADRQHGHVRFHSGGRAGVPGAGGPI